MHPLIRSVTLIVGSLTLAASITGCATQAQRQGQQMMSGAQASSAQYEACVATAFNDPRYSDLRRNLPMNAGEATLAQMANEARASPVEVGQLGDLHGQLTGCRRTALSQMANIAPAIVTVLAESFDNSDKNMLALAQHRISWGQYNEKQRQILRGQQVGMGEAGRGIEAQLNNSHQQELMQRQVATQAIANGLATSAAIMRQQQAINAMNRPVITNCNRFGNTVNCLSQ